MKKFLFSFGFFIFLIWIIVPLSGYGEEEDFSLVMVSPFQVHSDEPIDYIVKSLPQMLSSRLEADKKIKTLDELVVTETMEKLGITTLDEESARKIGKAVKADWVILGTITKIRNSISLDTKIVDPSAHRPTVSVFYQDKSLKGLINGVDILAQRIGNKISGKVIVTGISIHGNRLIEDEAILYQIKTRVGDVFSQEKIQEDIQNIYNMGYFNDIKVDSTDEPLGKKITFIVKENPEITEIRITGNKEVGTSEIQDELDIKLHTILDYNKVKDNALKIRRFYKGKGYYNALVDYKVQYLGSDKAAVIFEIVEHHPMKIKKITFVGNKNLKSKKIKKIMETREKSLLSFITGAGTFKEEALQHDLDRIRAFYYDHGYLDIKVGEPKITHDEKWIYITIPVEEGEQYRISEVKIAGDLIEPEENLLKQVKVTKDELFNRKKIHDDIMALTDLYGEYGYAFADITPLTNINADNKTVVLTYDIAKGQKVYFEKINITGNTRTRDKVIRREMRIREEDLYSNKKLKKSRERINNLGYFEEVKINTQKGSAPNKMTLEVKVKEKPTGMISAGAGYSSVDNLVGIFQISQNNFMGKGLRLTLMAQLGGNSRYRIALTEPYLFDKEISAGFDLFSIDLEYEDFDTENKGVGLSLGVVPFGLEDYRLGFEYNYSDVKISDVEPDADYEIRASEGTTQTSSITTSLTRDTVDDRFYPMRGSVNSISLELAGGLLGGENFFKMIIDSRWYFPFKWETAFMARGSAGYAKGYGGDDLPVFERFFLGGLDSLRGFEYRSVGPRGKENPGDVVGGNKMMLFNFEYLFPLIKAAKIRGLVFFDMGNSFREGENFDFDLRKSVGWGIRWQSPFGPLRIEWGLNLDPKEDEDRSQFEFSVGTGF
ncbi:MAG: outer membrane protein assembly factor BamA [Deltaproteobacteria bacterium]|nr:MAG: outer membrane protein assembly factor BamA [Deltaproteobacteria bacterium]